jgi:hypothetical protein
MRAIAARAENTLATLALGGIMLLPLGEIVLRRIISTGIPGAAPFTLNLTLWVGLLVPPLRRARANSSRSQLASSSPKAASPSGHMWSADSPDPRSR